MEALHCSFPLEQIPPMSSRACDSAAANGQEPPQKKRKPPVSEIPALPYDVVSNCLARVSRLYHPTLSLVSMSFRSILASSQLHATRSLLSLNEPCLYVRLHIRPEPTRRWFTLCRRPDRTLTLKSGNKKKKSGGNNLFVPIPSSHSPPGIGLGTLVSVGSEIYAVGGPISDSPSSSVFVLDCRTHTWRQAPSMSVARNYAVVSVCDGKIYVMGGCEAQSMNWAEVFDPKTRTWELGPSPSVEIREKNPFNKNAVIEGRIYLRGLSYVLVCDPREGRWNGVGGFLSLNWTTLTSCVIENVLYCYDLSEIKWYDSRIDLWKGVKGLDGLPKFCGYGMVQIVNYGGKLGVLWDRYERCSGYQNKRIWFAEIALEWHNPREIWGKVEWFDAVLTVPKNYGSLNCLTVMV